MEIVVIGDQNTVTGFRLAGVKRIYTPEDAQENLKKILSEETAGVLIMTEKFARENRRAVEEHQSSKKMTPIIVEVPDVSGPIKREVDPIRELIRRAIGADVQ
jgi:V/A-type H+-transporting ATPase subunit F